IAQGKIISEEKHDEINTIPDAEHDHIVALLSPHQPISIPTPPPSTSSSYHYDPMRLQLEEKDALIAQLKESMETLVTDANDRQILGDHAVVLEYIRKLRLEKETIARQLGDTQEYVIVQEEQMTELKAQIRCNIATIETLQARVHALESNHPAPYPPFEAKSSQVDIKCREAADLIKNADFIMIAAGAGFSADSGLPVYNDIAKVEAYNTLGLDYQDLCDPYWIHEDLRLFYGFWGDCLNLYRQTTPHRGYQILQKWKQRLVAKSKLQMRKVMESLQSFPKDFSDVTGDPFFIYTSNVDHHFAQFFSMSEIYEIHGNIEMWQCAGRDDRIPPCSASVWTLPDSFRFDIDRQTMYAQNFENSSELICNICKGPARPNILMFSDRRWISNDLDTDKYVDWEATMEDILLRDPTKKVVVLEMGCGMRVPSVRRECEVVVRDILQREYQRSLTTQQAKLIRINPDPNDDGIFDWSECPEAVLSIKGTSLAVLEKIESYIQNE
ncbi:hypothetical protein THRCLA_10304, partial [Thraustotheca clavata]